MKRVLPVVLAVFLASAVLAQNGRPIPIDSVQFVSKQELAKGNDDPIYYSNGNSTTADVITIEGVVCPMHPGFYGLSATSRKSTMLWQKNSMGWGGIEVMADPGSGNSYTDLAKLMGDIKFYDNFIPGFTVKCTGQLGDYQGNSQLYLTGAESEVTSIAKTEIKPIVLPLDSFKNSAGNDQLVSGEKYEHMYVEFKDVTVVNRSEWSSGRWNWSIKSASGITLNIRDYSGYYRSDGNNDSTISGTFLPPAEGARLEYIRGVIVQDNNNGYQLAPLVPSDVKVGTIVPPLLTSFTVTPQIPSSSDNVDFKITATDADGVNKVVININTGSGWTQYDMANNNGDDYEYSLDKQANGTAIQFYIVAEDNKGYKSYYPNETGADSYIKVLDGGISKISQIQSTLKANGESLYKDQTLKGIKITGIVTGSLYDFNGLAIIQDESDRYGAIFIQTKAGDNIDLWERGDEIEITEATVVESFGVTYLSDAVYTVKSFGNKLPAPVSNISIDSISVGSYDYTEAYEGLLISFDTVVITNQNPDAPSTYGEWSFGKDTMDGSASMRVDDQSAYLPDNFGLDSLTKGQELEFLTGIMYYSFGNWKLLPRDLNDIAGFGDPVTTGEMGGISFGVYPNPAQSVTRVRLASDQSQQVTVSLFDLTGRSIESRSMTVSQNMSAIDFDLSQLEAGTYILQIEGSTIKETTKLVKN